MILSAGRDTTAQQVTNVIAPEFVKNIVTSVVSSLLGDLHVASDTPLMDAGVDSLSAAELVQQLGL